MIPPFFNALYASDVLDYGHLLHRRLKMGQPMNNHKPRTHFLVMLLSQGQLHHFQQEKVHQNDSLIF
jgi:hypothetical protein